MAINIGEVQKKMDGKDSIVINVDNGDLKALDDIEKKWNFKDKESLLKFAMAVMLKADNSIVKISIGGEEIEVSPKPDLLNLPNDKEG